MRRRVMKTLEERHQQVRDSVQRAVTASPTASAHYQGAELLRAAGLHDEADDMEAEAHRLAGQMRNERFRDR